MLSGFKNFIENEGLFEAGDRVLLAVSGGMDSVVMCHLFHLSGYTFGIAHCNFQLRGMDADDDEQFVKQLSLDLQVPFYNTKFETEKHASIHKQSIQVAARELRYRWLEKIRAEQGYALIATAHHLSDSIETILYNFSKGCGIRGLHGIPAKNEKVIRPLLFAGRNEIGNYVKQQQIDYREDRSNASTKYARNKIRHEVVPVLQSINLSFEKTMQENIVRIKETEAIFLAAIEQLKTEIVSEKKDLVLIEYSKLPEPGKQTILFEFIRKWGFNNDQARQILEEHVTSSGRQFFSNDFRLVIGRTHYIISPKVIYQPGELEIREKTRQLTILDRTFTFSTLNQPPSSFPLDNHTIYLDLDRLNFPLKLRRWRPGDRFQPLGMNGHSQSLQDFFTHRKLSIPEKEKAWILESDGKICWVVGMRIDERFKLSEKTKLVLKIKVSYTPPGYQR